MNMATMTRTYGNLPTRDEVDALVEAVATTRNGAGHATLAMNLKGRDAATMTRVCDGPDSAVAEHGPEVAGDWNGRDVFNVLSDLSCAWGMGDDAAGELASSILQMLGVEWV